MKSVRGRHKTSELRRLGAEIKAAAAEKELERTELALDFSGSFLRDHFSDQDSELALSFLWNTLRGETGATVISAELRNRKAMTRHTKGVLLGRVTLDDEQPYALLLNNKSRLQGLEYPRKLSSSYTHRIRQGTLPTDAHIEIGTFTPVYSRILQVRKPADFTPMLLPQLIELSLVDPTIE